MAAGTATITAAGRVIGRFDSENALTVNYFALLLASNGQ
jgi:hypothetical protein